MIQQERLLVLGTERFTALNRFTSPIISIPREDSRFKNSANISTKEPIFYKQNFLNSLNCLNSLNSLTKPNDLLD